MSKYIELDPLPERLFVIGDIHGCVSEAAILCDYLQVHEKLTAKDQVIFIGDYIDRGPASKEVVELMMQSQKDFPQAIFLKGNHEDMLLDYLGMEGTNGPAYLHNGGVETLRSYGIDPFMSPEEILNDFPKDHLSFITNLERMVIAGGWVFAHAGLDPLRDLRLQLDNDLFWIRDEFIMNIHRFEKLIVFGHTAFQDLFFHPPYKLGIDTALVYGNKLTCVEMRGEQVLQIDHGSRRIKTSTLSKKNKGTQTPRFFGGM